jgi:hypothetical protein
MPELTLDIGVCMIKYPVLASSGGTSGKVNTFVGSNPTSFTSGLLNSATLLENNNLMCFALNVVKMTAPNYLSTLYGTVNSVLSIVLDAVNAPLLSLDCPQWKDITWNDGAMQDAFPGAKKAGRANVDYSRNILRIKAFKMKNFTQK